jgi:uroporphyrinogen III methyltransferase/synthase
MTDPLTGRTIVVTRPADRTQRLVNILDERGARVVLAPAIRLEPIRSAALTRGLRDLASGEIAWLVLTSPATVRTLDERLDGPEDVRAKVAAVGEGTALAYSNWAGREPDLLPKAFTVASLARACCVRARTSLRMDWRTPSRRRDGSRYAWTPTGRRSRSVSRPARTP